MDESITTSNVVKRVCNYLYIVSIGDFWHETIERPKWKNILYNVYEKTVSMIFYLVIFVECLEAIFNTFPPDQHRDSVSYSIAHINVFLKLYIFKRSKVKVKILLRDIIEVCQGYENRDVLKRQQRKINIAITLQFCTVYFALIMYALEGFRRMYVEGDIFVSVVTYWPKYEDRSAIAVSVRVLLVPMMFYMMAVMIYTEAMVISHLIILSLKCVTLRQYFERIGDEFLKNYKLENITVLKKKLTDDVLNGILMHRELLRISRVVNSVYGAMMSLQVCQSSGVAVLLLLRMAEQQTLSNIFMSSFFVISLFIQLALYLWNAGDITYNASLISNSIFHCGWYLCPMTEKHCALRHLVLMGCAQAQRPIVMKAAGIYDLSYETYVSVLRTTYSIFAVFY